MVVCGVRIDEELWQEALDAAGPFPSYGFEVPVALLESSARFAQRFELDDLTVVNIPEALPLEHAPYLDECPWPIQHGLVQSLAATLELGRCYGAVCASLDMGLDRIVGRLGIVNRADILEEALLASSPGPVLCMQVRVPRRFPLSREWRLARELVTMVGSERVAVAANVVIHDISPQPEPQEVYEVLGGSLRLVRFLLDGSAPECLHAETIGRWLEALKGWEPSPAVVFSARFRSPEPLVPYHRALARAVRKWNGVRRTGAESAG